SSGGGGRVAFEFRLPDIGEGLTEAEVTRWLVQVGQAVALDQPLVQVETDKAVTEIPAPAAGVLLHQGAPEGAVVRVGDVLAVIGRDGERWPDSASAGAEPAAVGREAAPIVGTLTQAAADGGRPQALPLVRRLARDLGVDLAGVRGTGPEGRITREDVERAAAAHPSGAARASEGSGPTLGQASPTEERVRLS